MRLFGLIGKTLSHSFSQAYFEEKFRREGITDAAYSLFELENIGLVPALIQAHPDLIGFNVTIPYKQRIIPLLDELSEEAATVGAVNTVVIQHINNQVYTIGHNTDIIGFQQSMQDIKLPDRALVLGTGGAAAAITYVLKRLGCACTAVSRDPKRGLTYSALTADIVARHRLIVNCTPLGTFPDVNGKPDIPYEGVSSEHFLYDLVYNPAETAFLKEGAFRGAHTCNGLTMLHAQAEAAWQLVNPSFFPQ